MARVKNVEQERAREAGEWSSEFRNPMYPCMISTGEEESVWESAFVVFENHEVKVYAWDWQRGDFYPVPKGDARARRLWWAGMGVGGW